MPIDYLTGVTDGHVSLHIWLWSIPEQIQIGTFLIVKDQHSGRDMGHIALIHLRL